MGKIVKIASATVLAAFAGLAVAGSAQAAGGKTVCIKPHKKFLKTQCGFDERRRFLKLRVKQRPTTTVNFRAGRILTGPAAQGADPAGGRGGNGRP